MENRRADDVMVRGELAGVGKHFCMREPSCVVREKSWEEVNPNPTETYGASTSHTGRDLDIKDLPARVCN